MAILLEPLQSVKEEGSKKKKRKRGEAGKRDGKSDVTFRRTSFRQLVNSCKP